MEDYLDNLLYAYYKKFGKDICVPIIGDSSKFIDDVKMAIATNKPIDYKKWYGDGTVIL